MTETKHRILIADDEPYIVHVLAIKLRNAGFETLTASDGEEALEALLAEKPDLVITDYQMPYLTGPEVLRCVREQTGSCPPSILITAREFDRPAEDPNAPRPDRVLAKPFSPRQVVRFVQELLAVPQKPLAGSPPNPAWHP